MKVLYLTTAMDVGGIETNLVRLTDELHDRGNAVTVASGPGVLVPELVGAGARHVEIPFVKRRPLAWLRSVLRLRALIEELEPDVVHTFSASGAAALWVALRLRARRRPPVISTIMGLKMTPEEPEWKTRLRAWGVTLGADRLIVTAPAIGEVVRRLPIRQRRVLEGQVVGLPASDDRVEPADVRGELGLVPTTRLVVTIGRLSADKSHHLLLEAAAIMGRRREDVHVLVVGGGPLADDLAKRLEDLGLKGMATLLGERRDTAALLRAADVCVKPGVVEGFVGMTVLEAQALGVPVVAFSTADVKLAIEDGVTGVIVPAGDVQALADAVIDLLDDPARAAALGEAGRQQVRRRFSMRSVVDGLLEIYGDVRRS